MTAKPTQASGALNAHMPEEKVGLLRKVAPVHSGLLRRRTRFLRASHWFEVRSSVLLLYKQRKRSSNPGFLESLFSKSPDADSIDSEIIQAASARGQWDAAFDMAGATVTPLSADEKGGSFPFRITFQGIFVLSVSVIDACDKDSPQRSLFLTASTAESRYDLGRNLVPFVFVQLWLKVFRTACAFSELVQDPEIGLRSIYSLRVASERKHLYGCRRCYACDDT